MVGFAETVASNNVPLDPNDERQRKSAAKFLWLIAEEYGLKTSDLAAIIDCSEASIKKHKSTRTLPKKGEFEVFRRVGDLLGIKKSLEIFFPSNPEIKAKWLHKKREIFKGKSAIELILSDRLNAGLTLSTIRRTLDMARNGIIDDLS